MTPALAPRDALRRLAGRLGVQLGYTDAEGRRVRASTDALLAVLRGLGVELERPEDAADALRRWDGYGRRMLPPTAVVRPRGTPEVDLRPPPGARRAACLLAPEEAGAGEPARWTVELDDLPRAADGALRLRLPHRPALGAHRLAVEAGGEEAAATLLAAPRRVFAPDREGGVAAFLPLYALRTARDRGVGDLADLHALARWARGEGCRAVGTLPLFAAWLDEPYDPSPYAPVSRLFWNELYADLEAAPELEQSPEARRLLASPEREALRGREAVDYRAAADLVRRVLDALATALFDGDGPRRRALEERVAADPELDAYARFRAAAEEHRAGWRGWPPELRERGPGPEVRGSAAWRRHAYAQWLVDERLAAFAADPAAAELYLDLPVGVHGDGFDVWAHREAFALDVSVGAPPDTFFSGGQDWGFPPLHPLAGREDGHALFRRSLRTALRHARWLRIDHVMALHRLWLVPRGHGPRDGAYVRYPSEELFAALAIESHRAGAVVVGEDLGTVPPAVTAALRRHGVRGMHVLQFALRPEPESALAPAPPGALVCPNTHDMPPFAAFWGAADVDLRRRAGLLDDDGAAREREERAALRRAAAAWLAARGHAVAPDDPDPAAVLEALLVEAGRDEGGLLAVALEDLWLEERPQNAPGMDIDPPSWHRRSARSLEELAEDDAALRLLRAAVAADAGRKARAAGGETREEAT